MTKLETLYEFAHEVGIDMIHQQFSDTKKAACLHLKPDKLIVLDKPAMDSPGEEVSILSEEVGHFETNALYVIEATHNTPIARSNRIKYEAKAKHWAYRMWLQPGEVEEAVQKYGGYGATAVAEHCNVTVEFLHSAIAYYRACGVAFSFDWCHE